METFSFKELMAIDPTQWESDIDPLGLLAYQSYKRKRGLIGEEIAIDEALTPQQRMQRKMLMRRLAPRLARARKISMKRRGGNDVLKRRATALARNTMAKKMLGGRNKADVSQGEKARVEKILAARKSSVDRLAVKLMSVVRQKQAARFAAKKPGAKPAPKKPAVTAAAKSNG